MKIRGIIINIHYLKSHFYLGSIDLESIYIGCLVPAGNRWDGSIQCCGTVCIRQGSFISHGIDGPDFKVILG